jgi:small subunit ribosomal protein S5
MNDSTRSYRDRPTDGFEEKIVQVNRVSKKTKGGNKIGFSVLTVVGDKKGKVGVGLGKGPEISSAIKKGVLLGKKHVIEIPIINGTIPFEVSLKLGAAKVMLKPAPRGSGVIAGGAVRSVVSLAGIENISSKVLGTKNQASNVYATIEALKRMTERYHKFNRIRAKK